MMRWLLVALLLLVMPALAQQVSDPAARNEVRLYGPPLVAETQYNAAETQFYVSPTGNDSNTCLSTGSSCLTIKKALDTAMATDARGGSLVINLAAGTYAENVTVSGTVPGSVNAKLWVYGYSHPQIILRGASAATTEILGVPIVAGQGYCYTVFANNGAYLGLEKLSIRSDTAGGSCGQSNLYIQLATVYILSDVAMKAATGNLIMLEESANLYVSPGKPTPPALTLAGNAYYGVVVSANSMFASDSTIAIAGPLTMAGGLLFYADEHSLIKMLLGNPAVTSGAVVTGRRFGVYGNSYMNVGNPPAVWPGSRGIIGGGSRYYAPDAFACAGGTAGCVNTVVPVGLGTGGTAAIGGDSGIYAGAMFLTAGAGAAASGYFGVGLPVEIDRVPGASTGGACVPVVSDGTGTWNPRASVKVSGFTTATGAEVYWDNNAVPLTSGQTYYVLWVCNTTR